MTFTATPGEIDGEAASDPYRPSHLSPSGASLFRQCPLRWKFRYRDRLPDPPGQPALVGTFAHRVLELLLDEPGEQRTIERAKEVARDAWPETASDEDFIALALDETAERQFRWLGWLAVEGLWKLEDPKTVPVESTELKIEVEIDGVPFRGIVDRIDAGEDGTIISDYKSGRAPKPRFTAARLSQVLLYAAAVRAQTGSTPTRARLLYLGQKVIDVEVTAENLAEVIGELQATWAELNSSCDNDEFEPQVGPLCGWCPFIESCAIGAAEVQKRVKSGRMRLDAPAVAMVAAEEAAKFDELTADLT